MRLTHGESLKRYLKHKKPCITYGYCCFQAANKKYGYVPHFDSLISSWLSIAPALVPLAVATETALKGVVASPTA